MNEAQVIGYLPIILFLMAAMAVGGAIVALSAVVGIRRPNREKLSPYECGMPPVADARLRFDVRFYRTALLFILFDVEIAFLFPWAVLLDRFGSVLFGLVEMLVFLGILVFGYLYAWRRGALEWS